MLGKKNSQRMRKYCYNTTTFLEVSHFFRIPVYVVGKILVSFSQVYMLGQKSSKYLLRLTYPEDKAATQI